MTKVTLLFDLDGTIVDTSAGFVQSLKYAFSVYGIDCPDDDFFIERISHGSIGIIEELCDSEFTTERKTAIRKVFLDHYQPISALNVEPYGEIVATLQHLYKADISMAVVTNKPEKLALPIMSAIGLDHAFKIIICPEQVSVIKPDPEGLVKACNYLGVDPKDAIYCGDHAKDICTAKNAGMKSIAVNYGFKFKNDDFNLWGADYLCHTPTDLCQLLLSFIKVK
ncbi:HAD family hydrolase [Psychromonas ossibalaenae]|uniref:HAD family hydrolase n=1 Tax=Psychromonas ossibalaenae TaxID=444922 RepID=UPI000369E17F|nr:HAD family hydrolase [Psychromonas ossibalaenae]